MDPIVDIKVIRVNVMRDHHNLVREKTNLLSKIILESQKAAIHPRARLFTPALCFGKGICEI
jgi:hypothetical protein